METFLITGYTATCIAVFSVMRIPLNRWTVPTASLGGVVLIFTLVQVLNYYHPYSGTSRQYLATTPITSSDVGWVEDMPATGGEHNLVAWFDQNMLFRLNDDSAAEVTFDSIPGQVFAGKVRMVLPTLGDDHDWAQDNIFDSFLASQSRIAVLIDITDPRYASYEARVPGGSHARTVIYGEQFHELALVRKTLLRMSAWMNYLSVFT